MFTETTQISLSHTAAYCYIAFACILGLIYGIYNWCKVTNIDTLNAETNNQRIVLKDDQIKEMNDTSQKIAEGANAFLWREYIYIFVFLIVFGAIIMAIDKFKPYTTIAFVLGAVTSLISGYIGMKVATKTNVRVAWNAATYVDEKRAIKEAFNVAFRGGLVMGFCLVSLALAVLTILIGVYSIIFKPSSPASYTEMFEYICGYGLGGSSVALFCRVGGGIYTKAADVGADLIGKNDYGFQEDSPDNPATIADNVGDNVGDIAGMGSDLFGSFAESTVASLVVSSTSVGLLKDANFFYPLMISATGILVCILVSLVALHVTTVTEKEKVESTLKIQLILSTVLLTPALYILQIFCLPEKFEFDQGEGNFLKLENFQVSVCCIIGLWAGMIIGYFTDYYTSNSNKPTQDLAKSCTFGAAINIIQGLALGYLSVGIPIIAISGTIFASYVLAGMYGISISALGMLSNLTISLTIDAYGPISDNAGGIAEMALSDEVRVRDITDALDAAGNTTAAVGKGFAIGSACLVSIALLGAFITRTKLYEVNLLEPIIISSLVIGAMIPFWFSAFTMKSVGDAAAEMCVEIKSQVENGKNEYLDCIKVSTNASLREMILPGVLVLFLPLLVGGLFGPSAVCGYLTGVIASGVQMAISASNSGGAWDNAKKYIEAQRLKIETSDDKNEEPTEVKYYKKKSKPHKAAIIGDTVGDPLKDTSGPSLNILIKLSAIVSLVFGSYFEKYHLLKV